LERTTSLKYFESLRRASQVSGKIGQFGIEEPKSLCVSEVSSSPDVLAPSLEVSPAVEDDKAGPDGSPARVEPVAPPGAGLVSESAFKRSSSTSCTFASRLE